MARIIVPYTQLKWPTVEALDAAHPDVWEACYVGGDDEAYWRLLSSLWADGRDFILVEQDIVVRPDTLAEFDACPHACCAAPYPYLRSDVYVGLGCIRFRAEFIRAHSTLWARVALRSDVKHTPMHWCTLDAWVQRELARSWPPHKHAAVGHMHRRPSHGCVPVAYMDQEGIPA